MTERLETVLEKISTVPNPANCSLMQEFNQFMVDNRRSDSYEKNDLRLLYLLAMNLLLASLFTILERGGGC
jgi:hypothetical protein